MLMFLQVKAENVENENECATGEEFLKVLSQCDRTKIKICISRFKMTF